jgi:NAD(P)-dependent dehydrogenase (short-subunit alcohol dehydrogenase family)
MRVKGSVALVTGANRGLGAAFAHGLLAGGATTVYGGARSDYTPAEDGIVPVQLDVTRPDQVAAAAARLADVTIVVNNAGVFHGGSLFADGTEERLRAALETNLFGLLSVSRAFAPVLAANGGGALVNILSVASWRIRPGFTPYAISKAAAWSATNGLRIELRPAGTLVVGVHAGFIDTDMAADVTLPKVAAADVVARVLAAVADDEEEVLVDDVTRQVKADLSADITTLYPRRS